MSPCNKCGSVPELIKGNEFITITCTKCKDKYTYDNREEAVNKWNLKNKR